MNYLKACLSSLFVCRSRCLKIPLFLVVGAGRRMLSWEAGGGGGGKYREFFSRHHGRRLLPAPKVAPVASRYCVTRMRRKWWPPVATGRAGSSRHAERSGVGHGGGGGGGRCQPRALQEQVRSGSDGIAGAGRLWRCLPWGFAVGSEQAAAVLV